MLAALLLLAAVAAVAAGSSRCELGGSWTTADPLPAQCEAKAWGCDKTGAQFWLTDTDDGFRGVAHGPADFVHAGNGPFQMGWSFANATFDPTSSGCTAPSGGGSTKPSCAVAELFEDCAPAAVPGAANATWKLLPHTRCAGVPSIGDWTGVKSPTECEAHCDATHGCGLFTWYAGGPDWSGQGGCWAYPASKLPLCATGIDKVPRNWTSGVRQAPPVSEATCKSLKCCWHASGAGPTAAQCIKPESPTCKVCVTLDSDAPGRIGSTSCGALGGNASDWSEHTCASCGVLAGDCDSIEWKTGPLSQNQSTRMWQREQPIDTIHMVFSTHFDVGCAWNVNTVMDLFFHRYIPQILGVQEGLRAMGYAERLPYLLQPWITSLYVDCPPHLRLDATNDTELICPTQAEVRRFEDALRRGDIVFQAAPFNLQPEAMSTGLFEGALDMVRTLCRRYNLSDTACGTVYSGRDVPGLSRGIVPLLRKHGVTGISVGTNGCVEPAFPWGDGKIQSGKPFVWKDLESGAELVSIWEQGYGAGQFRQRGDVQILPSGHALALQFMSDNSGSLSSVTEVLAYYSSLRSAFPGAKVIGSSLDAFYTEADKVKDQLPVVVTGEIGDVWIQGIGSDPHKMAEYKALDRARQACIDASDPDCTMSNFAFYNFTRLLLKYPEHTWGSAGYVNGGIDVDKWANEQFHEAHPSTALERSQYTQTAQTYAEQRRFNMFALEAAAVGDPTSFLTTESRKNLAALQPAKPSLAGLQAASSFSTPMSCGSITLAFDGTHGAIAQLSNDGVVWAGGSDESSALGQLEYVTHNISDFVWYHQSTANGCGQSICPCRACEHGFGKFNSSCGGDLHEAFPFQDSSEMSCANPTDGRYRPTMKSLHTDGKCRAVVELGFDPHLVQYYGAPQAAWIEVSMDAGSPAQQEAQQEGSSESERRAMAGSHARINLILTMWNKTSTRLPESTFFNFRPTRQNSSSANKWAMRKLGSWIDPTDVVSGGNQYQHGVNGAVRYGSGSGSGSGSAMTSSLTIESTDAILASPITEQPAMKEVCPGGKAAGADKAWANVSCTDIWCTWQGTPTAFPGGGTLATGLNPLEEVVGFGYNLHNNLWSVNYVVFSPYENDLWDGESWGIGGSADSNYQFRFALEL